VPSFSSPAFVLPSSSSSSPSRWPLGEQGAVSTRGGEPRLPGWWPGGETVRPLDPRASPRRSTSSWPPSSSLPSSWPSSCGPSAWLALEEIPPFGPQAGQRGSLQDVGSQGPSHTSRRVGTPPTPVKRFSARTLPPCSTRGGAYAVERRTPMAQMGSTSTFERVDHANMLWFRAFRGELLSDPRSGRDGRLLYSKLNSHFFQGGVDGAVAEGSGLRTALGTPPASRRGRRVPPIPSCMVVGNDQDGEHRGRCDRPPGLGSPACPLSLGTRGCTGPISRDSPACRRRRSRVAACTRGRRSSRKLDFASPEPLRGEG
jgi:hypothetical protein